MQRCQHLHPVAFPVSVGVLTQLGVSDPVPGVLDRPPFPHVLQQLFCLVAQDDYIVAGLVDRPSLMGISGSHRNDQDASWPVLLVHRGRFHYP